VGVDAYQDGILPVRWIAALAIRQVYLSDSVNIEEKLRKTSAKPDFGEHVETSAAMCGMKRGSAKAPSLTNSVVGLPPVVRRGHQHVERAASDLVRFARLERERVTRASHRRAHRHRRLRWPARCLAFAYERRVVAGDGACLGQDSLPGGCNSPPVRQRTLQGRFPPGRLLHPGGKTHVLAGKLFARLALLIASSGAATSIIFILVLP